jgi:hypothetical protein
MNNRTAAWLAWFAWALSVMALAVSLFLLTSSGNDVPGGIAFGLALLTFATVGVLITTRRPGNFIGWVFSAIALTMAADVFTHSYAGYAFYLRQVPLPGAQLMAWVSSVTFAPLFGLIGMLLLLFPNGKLPSARWRIVAWLGACGVVIEFLGLGLRPGPLEDFPAIENPIGVAGGIGAAVQAVDPFGWALLFGSVLASGFSLITRLRRARGEERQQIKWFVFAGAIAALLLLAGSILEELHVNFLRVFIGLALIGIPIAAGLAILKYRLYDIDLIIRRTLIYTALTGLLALAYFGSVLLLQGVVRELTGQSQSQAVTVVSTLAIAALFVPLRARVQAFIDRRFYRRKYDAARTLAAFGASVRDEVEMDALTERLLGVVDETMQPERVSLWLKH